VARQLKNLDDLELLRLYKENNKAEALSILFKRYYHLVYGVGMKYFKNSERAKDITSHVFEKLIKELKKHDIEYFKAWLYRVARNECLMEIRKNKTITKPIDESRVEYMENEEELHQLREKEDLLSKMELEIKHIPKEQRDCIMLFYLKRKTYKEICQETGFTFMQVKSHIQNGKRNLKNRILKAGG